MTLKEQMDAIYSELAREDIPWNIESPPESIRTLVDSGWVVPCDAVDLGCGAGNYAVWLASKDFKMTGLDISSKAIDMAVELAAQKGVKCRFATRDMTSAVEGLDSTFDFAYDWEVLHHVFPDDRHQYVLNVHRMLRPGGKYFSLCFSESDPPSFGGSSKFRTTPLGTTLYFSSEGELRELFEPLFEIEQLRTIEIPGKKSPHMVVEVQMSKKDA